MKTTFFVLLAILALASAGKFCSPSDESDESEERSSKRKLPEKSDDAKTSIERSKSHKVKQPEKVEHLTRLRMYDPHLYSAANQIQRRDARETLLGCPAVANWDTGSLLDIGCGSGDVTLEIITKVLPEYFERLVGVDLSEEMIRFARDHNSHPCISFEQLDIGLELEKQKLRDIEPFDHITSFNCLHWVTSSQPTTVANMFNLLKPGGDMLLLFVVTHPIYKVFEDLSKMDNWKEWMTDVEKIFSPYYYSKDAAAEYEQLLQLNGFTSTNVTVREMPYTFQTAETLRNTFAAVNPFLSRIPLHHKNAHLDDMVRLFTDIYSEHIVGAGFSVPYKSIVAYAKKPDALPSTSYGTLSPTQPEPHLILESNCADNQISPIECNCTKDQICSCQSSTKSASELNTEILSMQKCSEPVQSPQIEKIKSNLQV